MGGGAVSGAGARAGFGASAIFGASAVGGGCDFSADGTSPGALSSGDKGSCATTSSVRVGALLSIATEGKVFSRLGPRPLAISASGSGKNPGGRGGDRIMAALFVKVKPLGPGAGSKASCSPLD